MTNDAAALRALLAAATLPYPEPDELSPPSWQLAVVAVNALPALLAENEALRAALERLVEALGEPIQREDWPEELWDAEIAARAALEATPDGGVE